MRPSGNGRLAQFIVVKAVYVENSEVLADAKFQLLIEIAIIERTVVSDIHSVPAHHERHGLGVEIPHEQVHVTLEGFGLPQVVKEALHRHVGYCKEMVEFDAVLLPELLLVLRLERSLLWR